MSKGPTTRFALVAFWKGAAAPPHKHRPIADLLEALQQVPTGSVRVLVGWFFLRQQRDGHVFTIVSAGTGAAGQPVRCWVVHSFVNQQETARGKLGPTPLPLKRNKGVTPEVAWNGVLGVYGPRCTRPTTATWSATTVPQ